MRNAVDPATIAIETWDFRASLAYPSPAHLTVSPKPWEGVPYRMEGIPIQTCREMEKHAAIKNAAPGLLTYQALPGHPSNQYAVGQAPIAGIYTGVEGSCH